LPTYNETTGTWEPDEDEIDAAAEHEILLRHIGKAPAQPAPLPNPILFHPDLADREFGSHLLSVPKLTEWAAKQGLEVVARPPIERFKFVQVEALLCAIERAAMDSAPEPMAAAVVQATPHLAQNRAAEIAPRWLVSADAHQQWRRLLEKAIEAGELALLPFGSKLPVQVGSEPQAAAPAPVVTGSASNAPEMTPSPVATGHVAFAFDGLRGWNERAWKDNLGSPPKWLDSCIAIRGQQGIREHHWNPVLIGAALVRNGHAKQNSIRARFQTKPQLRDWLEEWKTYEADYLDND